MRQDCVPDLGDVISPRLFHGNADQLTVGCAVGLDSSPFKDRVTESHFKKFATPQSCFVGGSG